MVTLTLILDTWTLDSRIWTFTIIYVLGKTLVCLALFGPVEIMLPTSVPSSQAAGPASATSLSTLTSPSTRSNSPDEVKSDVQAMNPNLRLYEPFFEPVYQEFELMGKYVRSVFPPVHLGDLYKGRYRVMMRIGYGSYSTVRLAVDMKDGYVLLYLPSSSSCSQSS